jgi:hypothetical protein
MFPICLSLHEFDIIIKGCKVMGHGVQIVLNIHPDWMVL